MSDERRYYRLGLFVICAFLLAVATLLVFGSDVFSRPGPMLETYIDESVQGLDVGAPLKYRGVKIGRVDRARHRSFRPSPLERRWRPARGARPSSGRA